MSTVSSHASRPLRKCQIERLMSRLFVLREPHCSRGRHELTSGGLQQRHLPAGFPNTLTSQKGTSSRGSSPAARAGRFHIIRALGVRAPGFRA